MTTSCGVQLLPSGHLPDRTANGATGAFGTGPSIRYTSFNKIFIMIRTVFYICVTVASSSILSK
jgi:hypothetical protein